MMKYKGQEYDEDYMLECVKNFPKIKESFENAQEEVSIAESNLEDANIKLEMAELKMMNHENEWKDFKPYEDAKITALTELGGKGK